jgi:hypothetical protein
VHINIVGTVVRMVSVHIYTMLSRIPLSPTSPPPPTSLPPHVDPPGGTVQSLDYHSQVIFEFSLAARSLCFLTHRPYVAFLYGGGGSPPPPLSIVHTINVRVSDPWFLDVGGGQLPFFNFRLIIVSILVPLYSWFYQTARLTILL